ncbi:MAG: FAD-binding oxidoreductase [Micromonosporaceae bacterium]|nr:FAD-binding oxidoreductase [Micromonosporaceae bacterium]
MRLRGPVVNPSTVDTSALERQLRATVRGEVRFDTGSRALYATDASNYRQVPVGVVVPRDIEDVVAAVAACRRYGAPVLARGGGTSLAGQCCNVAVVLDLTKHVNRVESVDPQARTAVVQAGAVLDELNDAAAPHGLVFGPKPATHNHCTIGGMVGNNSCGATAQWAGTTAANVRRLEVLCYDGTRMWVGPTTDEQYAEIQAGGGRPAEIYRAARELRDRYLGEIRTGFPHIPRRISGYNLPELLPENGFNLAQALVGSESTCVTILRAELALLPAQHNEVLLLAGYPDVASAGDHVPLVNRFGPYILEGLDDRLIDYERKRRLNTVVLQEIPPAGGWLMVKLTGSTMEHSRQRMAELVAALRADGELADHKVFDDPAQIREMDSVREVALGATARVPGMPDTWPGWEDSAVPPERVGAYLRDLRALLDEYGYGATSLYGHLGHGCVHNSIPFDLTSQPGIAAFRSFVTRAARLVVSHGGSFSGEHGDGQARGELLPIMFGPRLVRAFEEFKAIFDPDGRMNPGKVVHANPLDSQLRLGPGYPPPQPRTRFSYPLDGDFSGTTTRCFGVGECRRHDTQGGGVMCPSYQVTREEKHSTRGRSRLLFEMMRGEVITGGWRSPEVHEALDLCLACKGCKSDCPVDVDMARYKAEFLSHHYAGRLRPRIHYALGWLPLWARLAAPVPFAANALTRTPGLSRLAKAVAGIDPRREVPAFAPRRFTDAWPARGGTGGTDGAGGAGVRGSVLLWPDTFTNNLQPRIPAAAVRVLEAAGFQVLVPPRTVCCGLTWISTGQLGMAKRVLRRSLRLLAPYLRAGLPVVGLEPSCTSVLRADAGDLLAGDAGGAGSMPADLRRLRDQTVTLAELLTDRAPDFAPQLSTADGEPVAAIVQAHCHQHATLGFAKDTALMRRIGLRARVLDSGCCGLAGDFGMTREHREVSLACAERVLLPEVRAAAPGTLLLADGFSCRTQVAGAGTGRRPVHLAEVLDAAVSQQAEACSRQPVQSGQSRR